MMIPASWLLLGAKLWPSTSSAHALVKRESKLSAPRAFQVDSSQNASGADGPWGTFVFQFGDQRNPQQVHLLPSTYHTFPLVVTQEGCNPDLIPASTYYPYDEKSCKASRGGIFECRLTEECSKPSWSSYSLSNNQMVAGAGFSNLSLDFMSAPLSWGWQDSGNPVLSNMAMGGLVDETYTWTGLFGLDPKPTNFTGMGSRPSVLATLKNQSIIPSLSWSYTAGASYRQGDWGSLTLGGIDMSRTTSPVLNQNEWWPFYNDVEIPLSVTVMTINFKENNTVATTTAIQSKTIPAPKDMMATIDSSRPYLQFPQEVCDAIASQFGLTWDETYKHYLINDTQHKINKQRGISLDFTIGAIGPQAANDTKANFRTIKLPYDALSLKLTYPQFGPAPNKSNKTMSRYLPIMRAPGDTYILGRALLQEAVISADYERKRFMLEPQRYTSPTNIVAIPSLDSAPPNQGLSTAMIAGIVIAVIMIVALAVSLIWCCRRRKQRRHSLALLEAAAAKEESLKTSPHRIEFELDGLRKTPVTATTQEVPSSDPTLNLTPPTMPINHVVNGAEADSLKYLGDNRDSRPVIRIYYEMDATEPTPELDTILAYQDPKLNTSTSGTNSQSSTLSSSTGTGISSLGMTDPNNTLGTTAIPKLVNIPPSRAGLAPAFAPPRPMFSQNVLGKLNPGDRTPASPIPPTPLEFYGGFGKDGRPLPTTVRGINARPGGLIRGAQERAVVQGNRVALGLPIVTFTPATPEVGGDVEREAKGHWGG